MDWIKEHFNIILTIAGVIAYWLNQRNREKNGEAADYDGDGVPDVPGQKRELDPVNRDGEDPEAAERVRRIKEDIARKIAERRGQPAPAVPEGLPRPSTVFDPFQPVFREESVPVQPPPLRAPAEPSRAELARAEEEETLERQRRLAEQFAELEKQRREARRLAQANAERGSEVGDRPVLVQASVSVAGGRSSLSAELRDPRAMRRAFILREVLDAPVALR